MKQNRIAITGGIGSGKTEVVNILREKGYVVFCADEISREVSNDTTILNQIKTVFGEEFITEGKLNRARLRQYVFESEELTNKLNNIMHPAITKRLKEKIANEVGKTVFVEIPLLYSSGMEKLFDSVWYIFAPTEERLVRIINRDGMDKSTAENIMTRQQSDQLVCGSADETIINDGTLEKLKSQIEELLAALG